MNTRSLVAVMLGFMFVGCSDRPSVSDARRKIEDQVRQQSNGLIRLVSFEKTDGSMQEMMGMKGYEMSYSAEVEFLDDVMWSGGNNLSGWDRSFHAQRGRAAPAGGLSNFFNLSQGFKPAKKGDRFRFMGRMDFEKTERGWH